MWGRLSIYVPRCCLAKEASAALSQRFYSHHKVARNHVKVYMPGEKIPSRKDKKITLITDDSMSVDRQSNPFAYGNNIFKEVMEEAVKSSTRRHIVLEGERMIEEGFIAGLQVHKLFIQKGLKDTPQRLKPYIEAHNIELIRVSQTSMKIWSSLVTPPGIVGVFVKPRPEDIRQKVQTMKSMPVTVVCDNVREPGNLGAILRSAAGAGCKRILLSKGCADPWESKALRAGCGAHFYLPIIQQYPLHNLSNCMELESKGDEDDEKIWTTAENPSQEQNSNHNSEKVPFQTNSTLPTSIPENRPSSSFALFLADNHDARKSVPIIPYASVEYKKYKNVYLVVGGETEGLSKEILYVTKTLQEVNPQLVDMTVARLQIPLSRNIESLNAGHAFACIIFEMLRQFQQ